MFVPEELATEAVVLEILATEGDVPEVLATGAVVLEALAIEAVALEVLATVVGPKVYNTELFAALTRGPKVVALEILSPDLVVPGIPEPAAPDSVAQLAVSYSSWSMAVDCHLAQNVAGN